MESNNLRVKQIETIQVNRVAQIPPRAIWLHPQHKIVYSSLDDAYRDHICGSDAEQRLTTVASIMQGLHQSWIPLLNNHLTSSLTYRPCSKCLNQGKKPFDACFSILDNKKTHQPCRNSSGSRLHVAIRTRPHPETTCIISCCLMVTPPYGPSAKNHMNCLLVAWNRRHRIC